MQSSFSIYIDLKESLEVNFIDTNNWIDDVY